MAGHCDGQGLQRAIEAATAWLEQHVEEVNALNVFPVPDGDTGTNMLLTMQAALREVEQAPRSGAAALAEALARGALMGARGNSGVILSQILRGLARGLGNQEGFGPPELAVALQEASTLAYQGVSHPVEGTILTVARRVGEAAPRAAAASGGDLRAMLEMLADRAAAAVAETPSLLPVLAEAGVVDAGGQGLYFLLEGVARHVRGEDVRRPRSATPPPRPEAPALRAGWMAAERQRQYGYCTEFLLEGRDLNLAELRGKVDSLGDSGLVVGDGRLVHVHVHAFDPGAVLSYATSLGTLRQIKIENLEEQRARFLWQRAPDPGTTAVVAVASGPGLMEVVRSLGAAAVVSGGQTMNPSTQELLAAVEAVAADRVILLPNNRNILPTAQQVAGLTAKVVRVVPTENVPEGVAALLAFNYEADLDDNVAAMAAAAAALPVAEVTRAVRSVSLQGLAVRQGQVIGLLNGTLQVVGEEPEPVALALLASMGPEPGKVVTIYAGEDVTPTQAAELARQAREGYRGLEVELVEGGQPHYSYIFSLE